MPVELFFLFFLKRLRIKHQIVARTLHKVGCFFKAFFTVYESYIVIVLILVFFSPFPLTELNFAHEEQQNEAIDIPHAGMFTCCICYI